MPRTKRPVKRQEKTSDQDEYTQKFNQLVQEGKTTIELQRKKVCREIEMAFEILLSSFSSATLQRTVGDLKNELYLREVTNTRPTVDIRPQSRTDDGYLTANSSQSSGGRPTSRMRAPRSVLVPKTTRRSRSVEASSIRKPSTARLGTATKQRRRSKSVYQTPIHKNATNYPPITPKVAPNAALTVLRQPRQGEMVLSMTGSPVMVPNCYTMQSEEKANCNILLQDGTMLSLLPKQLRQSQTYIPFSLMDSKLLHQLKTLKENIDTVVKLGESSQIVQ